MATYPKLFRMTAKTELSSDHDDIHNRPLAYPSYESRPRGKPCESCGIKQYPRTYPLEVIIDNSGVEIPNILVPPDTGSSFVVDERVLSVLRDVAGDEFDATEIVILNRDRYADKIGSKTFYDILPKWRMPVRSDVPLEDWAPSQPACPKCGLVKGPKPIGAPKGTDWDAWDGQQLFTTTLWSSMSTVVSRAVIEAAREHRWTGVFCAAVDTAWRPRSALSFTVHDDPWPPKKWFYPPQQR